MGPWLRAATIGTVLFISTVGGGELDNITIMIGIDTASPTNNAIESLLTDHKRHL